MKGKRCLIVGATGGLGQAISTEFGQSGARLFLHGHTNKRLLEQLADNNEAVEKIIFKDLSRESEVQEIFKALPSSWSKGLDILVFAAGINPTAKPLTDISLSTWNEIISVNLTGAFLSIKHGAAHMVHSQRKTSESGKIVLVSSVFGLQTPAHRAAYGASKHGLTALVQAFSKEMGGKDEDIQINAVCPGPVWGDNVHQIFIKAAKELQISVEEYSKQRFERIPVGRFLRPEELAKVTRFLASEDNSYINGQCIPVTGGAIE